MVVAPQQLPRRSNLRKVTEDEEGRASRTGTGSAKGNEGRPDRGLDGIFLDGNCILAAFASNPNKAAFELRQLPVNGTFHTSLSMVDGAVICVMGT